MKKLIVLLSATVLVLAFALTGCGASTPLYRSDVKWADGEVISYKVTSSKTAEEDKGNWILVGKDKYTDDTTSGEMKTTITRVQEETETAPERWRLESSFTFTGKYMKYTDSETLQSAEKTFTIENFCELESLQLGRGRFVPTKSERIIKVYTLENEDKNSEGLVELKERYYKMTADYTEKSGNNYKNTIRCTVNEWGGTAFDKPITDYSELTKDIPQEFTRSFNPGNIFDNEMLIFATRTVDLSTAIAPLNVFNTLETNIYSLSLSTFTDNPDEKTKLTPVTVTKTDGQSETFNCMTYQLTRSGTIGIPIKFWVENDYSFQIAEGAVRTEKRNMLVKMQQDNFIYELTDHNYTKDADGNSSIIR